MNKVAYIILGYRQDIRSKSYDVVANLFNKKEIDPVKITIHWKYHTMSDYVDEFLSQVKFTDSTEIYFLDFLMAQ